MNAQRSGGEAAGIDPAEPVVEGAGVKVVQIGSADGALPQGVFGVEAVSRRTVGSEGIFMSRHRVPPGMHVHANCESAVYVLRGRGYAYYGEEMDGYVEGGPGDFVYIPANLVGCPAGGEPLEYVVARDAPEEIVVTLREAGDLPIGPDGRMHDA